MEPVGNLLPQIPCPNCGGTLIKAQGQHGTYLRCPSWKPNGAGCEGYTLSLEKARGMAPKQPSAPPQQSSAPSKTTTELEILQALQEIKTLLETHLPVLSDELPGISSSLQEIARKKDEIPFS